MLKKIHAFLNANKSQDSTVPDDTVAIACLLCEVANADHSISEEEATALQNTLCKLLQIDNDKAKELLSIAKETIRTSNSLFQFTSELRALDQQSRIDLISAMWEIAYADNHLDPHEEAIIRRVAQLIYVAHSEFIRTKLAVIAP
ncbi:TerB family tellurite resistance protein [Psychromonas sp.]|uniref:tellurite resistance TerB family protein n=1 Tax=Psychromonas sp. TaxID=1884585 RepID=UPI003569D754